MTILVLAAVPMRVDAGQRQRDALKSARLELEEARKQLRTVVSDCNGGDILVRACPSLPPCNEPIAPCSMVAALRATNAAISALDAAAKP